MARITREDALRVAALARLSLSDAEAERMSAELDQVLEYVQLLRELDTQGVAPTAHAIPLPTPMRPDRPLPPLDPAVAVSNAPEHSGDAFVVPRVIGDEEAG